MFAKTRNILMLVCVAAVLCCTVGFKALYRAGFSLPSVLGTGDETSYLEGRQYTKLPTLSLGSFAAGSFQDEFESYVDDALPMRESLLNLNRSFQRICISQSASLFGFEVYPTFFGSSYVYCPADGRVYEAPKKSTDEYAFNLSKTAEAISCFSDAHPELNVTFAMPYRSGILNMGPVANLVSNQIDQPYLQSMLYDKISSSVSVVDLTPASYEEFDTSYFRTDHHWNIEGAYKAYTLINSAMGNEDATVENGELLSYENACWYGASARSGLDLDVSRDAMEDYEFDLPELTVTKDGIDYSMEFLADTQAYKAGFAPANACKPLYEDYFHQNYGEFTITNSANSNGKTLLLVGDSFSNCIERLFAASYQTVYVFDPRYSESPVEEFVASHPEISDVLFLETYNTLLRGKL